MTQPDATPDNSEYPASEALAKDGEPHGVSPNEFEKIIGAKEKRMLKARREGTQSPWFGLGMFGLVGWSVVVPTLLGILVGAWIDNRWPNRVSWTVTFLFVGLFVGCYNAWHWIQKESANE